MEGGLLAKKEVDIKLGDFGNFSVDATKEGKIEIALTASKELEGGLIKLKSENSASISALDLLEKIAKKNDKVWDEVAIQQIRNILGLVG